MCYVFLSDAERVWIRMKEIAADLAFEDGALSFARASGIISDIIREEHAAAVPEDAREYFASELQRMVSERAQSLEL
jgi:hypothetical protein